MSEIHWLSLTTTAAEHSTSYSACMRSDASRLLEHRLEMIVKKLTKSVSSLRLRGKDDRNVHINQNLTLSAQCTMIFRLTQLTESHNFQRVSCSVPT